MEYQDEGGTLQWFAQTCPEVGSHITALNALPVMGPKQSTFTAGVMDYQIAQKKLDDINLRST